MFCPDCKSEYRVGFTRCSDCDVDLVDSLEVEEAPQPDAEFVVVASVQGYLREEQILSFLRANGIPAHVRGEAVGKVYGIMIDGLGKGDILVPAELADTARDLLEKADDGELNIEEAP